MAVSEVTDIDALYGAELAVICAPNNPTGTQIGTDALAEIARHADMVLLDESFADVADTPLYCAETLPAENIICLKSFGKFFGLAGSQAGLCDQHAGLYLGITGRSRAMASLRHGD